MKKLYVSIIVIILLVSTIASVTFAWFTYVERKSLATFEAGELSITMKSNDANLDYDLVIDDLVFIDYENEVLHDQYDVFNHVASSTKIDIISDPNAPLSRHLIQIDETNLDPGLIYVIIYDGMNLESELDLTTDYHTYITAIISSYETKIDQLNAIKAHNQVVLNVMYDQIMHPEDVMTFQIVMWADYDTLNLEETYLDQTFILSLKVDSINDKGALVP